MKHFTFGRNNGLRVSELALGAGNFGTGWGYGADLDTSRAIVDRFAEAGGTFIDTAATYQVGQSEEFLGRILAGRREDVTLATKFAVGGTKEGSGALQTGNGRRAMFRSVEHSLRRLDTDYIDLLWVHWPDFVTPVDEIVRAFHDLVSSGKVLYAGLSNFPAWLTARGVTLAEVRGWSPISAVQFEYSLVERTADRDVLPMVESLGLGAALWSPLGGGLLTGKYRDGASGRLTEWNKVVHSEDGPVKTATVDEVLAVAAELDVPPGRVAVAWLLERGRRSPTGVVPIIGPRTVEQLDEYLAALNLDLGDHYGRLDEVSRISLGQPHQQISEQLTATRGGGEFRPPRIPSA
ncbi:aldo/keto reductase [Mycolicibacterium sediminis]|uniref:Oxidoreductase n=1 Tax=Mycolicibacterium sediminis TaxID=1286180 RepID=A0A7I7QM71_9MYCO|nr:aldo/keto reductase [Mycolicibacterium sediminis]BBY27423.1 oxidoreductase [Mycolicibacterium sediminis]